MTEWREALLGDLFQLKHGFAFKSEFYRDSGDLILLTPGNFRPTGGLQSRGDREKFYEGPVPDGFLLSRGDLLVVMTDLTQQAPILGSAGFVPESDRFLHNQRLGKVVELSAEVEPLFLYSLLNSESVRSQIRSTATGSTVRHTSPDRIYQARAAIPPISEQRRIAGVLTAYDELIENNLRRIEILEEMSQALYREWFVKFHYPGHEGDELVDSPLGRIPAEWVWSTLEKQANVVMGQSPKSEFYNEDGVGLPFHQGVTHFGRHFPTHVRYCTVTNRMANEGDVLVSVRAPVGRINVADEELVVGRGLAAVASASSHQGFLYRQLKERFRAEDSMGGGTIFKAITKADLLGLPIVVPPRELVSEFESYERPTFELIRNLTRQNKTLRATRDLLLPKLISGEIDVSDLDIDTSWLAA